MIYRIVDWIRPWMCWVCALFGVAIIALHSTRPAEPGRPSRVVQVGKPLKAVRPQHLQPAHPPRVSKRKSQRVPANTSPGSRIER